MTQKKTDRIIVIGNAPSAVARDLGPLIDTFEEVVRINNFVTDGFESKIGTKTTIWLHSDYGIKPRDCRSFSRVIMASPPQNQWYPPGIVRRWRFEKMDKAAGRPPEIINRRWWRQQQAKYPLRLFKYFSTGLIGLLYLLEEYQQIHYLGFDFFQKIDGKPRHYFKFDQGLTLTSMHDPSGERSVVEKLVTDGRLIQL